MVARPLTQFKRIVGAAALSGLLAGLVLTAVQQWQVAPLIAQAEVFEDAAADQLVAPATVQLNTGTAMQGAAHEHSAQPGHEQRSEQDREQVRDQDHEHEHEWQPENGWQRTVFSLLANVTLAVGFGLLVGAAMNATGRAVNWQRGLLWGVAGYLVLFVAPALGLPPELPGSAAAPLQQRQLWWLFAVLASGGGLACLTLTRSWLIRGAGLALIVAPLLMHAPLPLHPHSSAPAALAHDFVRASALANALLWLVLSAAMGYWYRPAPN